MLFHVVSNEGMMYHYPDCPIGSEKPGQAYKPGPGPPKDIIYKKGLYIFLELSKETGLEKCLHGKTQNAKESFNGTIWDSIRKNSLVTLPNLEFGRYNGVAHCILE